MWSHNFINIPWTYHSRVFKEARPLRVFKEARPLRVFNLPDFGPFGTECGKTFHMWSYNFINIPWTSPLRVFKEARPLRVLKRHEPYGF
jgi:hypothetical protein